MPSTTLSGARFLESPSTAHSRSKRATPRLPLRGLAWTAINLFQMIPLVPAPLRQAVLRWCGATIGRDAWVGAWSDLSGRRITLGDRSRLGSHVYYDGGSPLVIGSDVGIGPFVRFVTHSHVFAPSGPVRKLQGAHNDFAKPITIGSGCEILSGVTILGGVTIAPGCVIAAGAMVVADTQPNGLYAGVPAVRKRSYAVG